MSEIINQTKQKILFIQPRLSGVGGIEKVVPLVASGLENNNYISSSATFYGNAAVSLAGNQYFHNEKKQWGIFGKIIKIFKRFFWLNKIIKYDKPDYIVVSAHGASLSVLVLKMLKLTKEPILIYEHQSLAVNDFGYGFLRALLYRYASGFIAVSKGVNEEITKKFPNTPSVCVYNPVLPSIVKSSVPIKPVFVTASRIENVKGVDILVNLFIKYKKQGGLGELRIYGEGSLVDDLERSVSEADLDTSIKFMGVTSLLTNELGSVTAYISCARKEALGVSLVEALSAGVPIVCLDAPYGPREIMEVDPEMTIKYPFISSVGILYGNLNNMNYFNQSLKLIIEKRSDFIEPALRRSTDFSLKSAVSNIDIFLTKIKVKHE